MPLDVWKFVYSTVRVRNAGQKPVSESSSGVAQTHPSLEDTAYEAIGTVVVEKRFVCRDGVEARRLLVITRNDLLREAEDLYAGNGICDEAWRIRIFKKRKGNLYNVYVHYQGQAVKAGKQPNPSQPVSLEQAEGVALGLMTILKKQDIYATYQE